MSKYTLEKPKNNMHTVSVNLVMNDTVHAWVNRMKKRHGKPTLQAAINMLLEDYMGVSEDTCARIVPIGLEAADEAANAEFFGGKDNEQ